MWRRALRTRIFFSDSAKNRRLAAKYKKIELHIQILSAYSMPFSSKAIWIGVAVAAVAAVFATIYLSNSQNVRLHVIGAYRDVHLFDGSCSLFS